MKKLLITLTACAYWLGAAVSISVWADDTEIYVTGSATSNSPAQPNVLFVFDTSGSMNDYITTLPNYNPANTYGSSSTDYYYFYEQDYTFVKAVHTDHINCQSLKDTIAAQPDNPVFNGRVAWWPVNAWQFWSRDRWLNVKSWSGIGPSNPLECEADRGVHGANATDPDTYAANRNYGPYSNNPGKEVRWSNRTPLIATSANFHDFLSDASNISTRKKTDIMKDAAKDLVDDFNGLNLGLMRFDGGAGGYVIHHFQDITPAANKAAIKASINTLPASGTTPLAETLWEASRYFRGDSVDYGTSSVSTAVSSGDYISPMTHSCQKNHLVYLTDGQPYGDSGRDSQISALTGNTCSYIEGASEAYGTCFDELAEWMKSTDHSSLTGIQDITLHAIGFDINLELLKVSAQKGGGKLYNASDATELKTAFNQIILSILSTDSTFAAPAVTVNAFNNLQHRDELYYAIFRPMGGPRWPGNLKRYHVTRDGVILDANQAPAMNPTTGFFKDTARSDWSSSTDGYSVTEGGFAEQMSPIRNIYTYTGSAAPSNERLNALENIFDPANTLITNSMLGLDPSTAPDERKAVMDWIAGIDVEGVNSPNPVHAFISDPLHSRPRVVTYGGTENAPDDTVFFATNMGHLHAVDSDNGQEVFSFMPQALLPNGLAYLEDDPTNSDKVYGLDGAITVYRQENPDDVDVTIEAGEGDKVYVYVGMRRGGGNYYAIDATNRSDPRLMWRIEGGSGEFLDLAQTWSAPKLAKVRWNCDTNGDNCADKLVLLFAGGYDPNHDVATLPTTGDAGAAVFMVDATTGALLWSAGRPDNPTLHDLVLSEMHNSIPADLTLADMDNDGYLDLIYTVDITGHLWRFDINQQNTNAGDFATGGITAKLGDYDSDSANDEAHFRRFFYAPDVTFFQTRGDKSFLSIALGSGYRAHPRDTTVTDRFYVVFDPFPFGPPTDSAGNIDYSALGPSGSDPLDEGDLFDATSTLADRDSTAPHGWYKTLQGADEKALAQATTFGGTTIFTTYLPHTNAAGAVCAGNLGSGRTYILNPLTGGGMVDTGDSNPSEYIQLAHSGIPPAATIVYTDASETYLNQNGDPETNRHTKPIVCIGTECFGDLLPSHDPLARTFWRENR